jgi:hypothetical protein
LLCERPEDRAATRLAERGVLAVLDHGDDYRDRTAATLANLAADCIGLAEQAFGERTIDDGDALGILRVELREIAARADRNLQRREIVRRD